MFPILACSVVALAIIAERFWTLRPERIAPDDLVVDVWRLAQAGELTAKRVTQIREGSALGRILASGLSARHLHRTRVKENIEDVGRHVVHELEKYLNTLGTIASITPLLGLLGTVIGMIKVFAVNHHPRGWGPGGSRGRHLGSPDYHCHWYHGGDSELTVLPAFPRAGRRSGDHYGTGGSENARSAAIRGGFGRWRRVNFRRAQRETPDI